MLLHSQAHPLQQRRGRSLRLRRRAALFVLLPRFKFMVPYGAGVPDLLRHPDQVLGICRRERYEAEGKVGKAHRKTHPIKVRAAGPAPGNTAAFGSRRNNQQAAFRLHAYAAKCGVPHPVRGTKNACHQGRT